MALEIRPATSEEILTFGSITAYVFAGAFGDDDDNLAAQANRPEWTLCGFVDGVMAASFSTLPFQMYACGKTIGLGGVTAVGTLPEYRRRGILRKMMTQALSDMRERDQPLSSLWASQAAIYQRYGYSLAGQRRSYTIDTVEIGFHDGNVGEATVARVSEEEGFDDIKAIYEAFAGERMGYLARRRGTWRHAVLSHTDEEGPAHIAIATRDGRQTGYVVYTMRDGKVDHPARGQHLNIRDLVALDDDAYRSLWRFIASHDLVGKVTWPKAPMDDPAMLMFTEPRLLRARDDDGTWLRVVDAEMALSGRGYRADGELSIKVVEDSLAPWNEGTYRVRAADGEAEVQRTSTTADITTTVNGLSSMYSGFASATQLSMTGAVAGDADSLKKADQLFFTPFKPHCADHF